MGALGEIGGVPSLQLGKRNYVRCLCCFDAFCLSRMRFLMFGKEANFTISRFGGFLIGRSLTKSEGDFVAPETFTVSYSENQAMPSLIRKTP